MSTMATSSPIPNNKVDDSTTVAGTVNGNTMPQRPFFLDTPKQNLRGLNKPKCIKCGNVARSRCPFQSCKSCCFNAQNPCYIHVIKQAGILPDKPPLSVIPSNEQPPAAAPLTGTSWRLSSLRQLSTTLLNSIRTNKPLTSKDAASISRWRFSKLKQHIRGNIDTENEAFERYLRNVSLLEETFSVNERLKPGDDPTIEAAVSEDKIQKFVSMIKVKLKSNNDKANIFRERLQVVVDQKLRKLRDWDLVNDGDSASELDANRELKRPKVEEWQAERTAAVNDLMDKLNKIGSEDDMKFCLEMKHQLFNYSKNKDIEEPDSVQVPSYSLPEVCSIVPIDQDTLSKISADFLSLNEMIEL